MNVTSNLVMDSLDGRLMFRYGFNCSFKNLRRGMMRVYCDSTVRKMQTRKYAPLLESIPQCNGVLPSTNWKAVPDIWRTSAEKFGDRIALVDPYHDPPTNLTYKQGQVWGSIFC